MYCPNPSCPNLLERGEPAEFRDDVAICAECGHELEHGHAPSLPAAEPRPEGWTRVAVYDSPETAHTARGLLETEGIEAIVVSEHLAGSVPADLSVPESEAGKAMEIIQAYSISGSELPLEDRYTPADDRYSWPAEAARAKWPWQVPAVLILITLAVLSLIHDLSAGFYDPAKVSKYVALNLPHELDHLEKSDIDLILELDLQYIDTLGLADGDVRKLLELELDDAVRFVGDGSRECDRRFSRGEIAGVLELRNRYLARRAA